MFPYSLKNFFLLSLNLYSVFIKYVITVVQANISEIFLQNILMLVEFFKSKFKLMQDDM